MVRLIALLALALPLHASLIYDLVTDFSATTNPTSVWSYGSSSTPTGALSLWTFTEHDPSPDAIDYWVQAPFSSGFPNYYPQLRHNASDHPIDNGNGFILPTDMLSLDPGESLLAGVRFTAPATDFYSFSGEFQGLQNCCGGPVREVYIYDGADQQLDAVLQNYEIATFTFGLNLSAGDFVDFRARAITVAGNSTGLAVTVTEAAPEPGTLILLAFAGAAGLRARRGRQTARPSVPLNS